MSRSAFQAPGAGTASPDAVLPSSGLLRAVVDAGDAHRGQLQASTSNARSRTAASPQKRALRALADLVVVVHQGDHLVAEPAWRVRLIQQPVAEQGEVIRRVGVTR